MNRKKTKKAKAKKKPPWEGCAPEADRLFAKNEATDSVFHLRLIQGGGHIVELYERLFPTEFKRSGIDYTSARSLLFSYDSFARLVDEHLFPVWEFSALSGIYDEPAYCLESMSICLYGGNYFYWERMQDLADLPLVEKLIVNAYSECDAFRFDDFFLPKDHFFSWELLSEACARERGPIASLILAAEAVLGQTGNFWMDVSEEAYYQAEEPAWNETNINYFASEWIEAKAMKKDVERFFSWVGHNYARAEKVKRLLRKAWAPREEQEQIRARARLRAAGDPRPLVETLGGFL